MKKLEYFGFALFLIFSFYITDRIMIYIDSKSPLMEAIVNASDEYNVKPVNAIINGETIIPGISGKEINKHKSLVKMEEFGFFNENNLIFDLVNPKVSVNNNKDKIIVKGNVQKRSVSLILEENKELENYLDNNNINYSILANLNSDLSIKREYINSEKSDKNFSDLNALLNKKDLNRKICLLNYSNKDYCLKEEYFIVKESLNSKMNIIDLINNINSGDIILISNGTSLETLRLILSEIKKLDLKIVYLSELINE